MIARTKLLIVKLTPWWVLRGLWLSRLVRRETVFRWEMNLALGEWNGPCPLVGNLLV